MSRENSNGFVAESGFMTSAITAFNPSRATTTPTPKNFCNVLMVASYILKK
jgi:hypothetical protein